LIGFVPDALGEYLNGLREKLVPGCPFSSHITLLPPRLLSGQPAELTAQVTRMLAHVEPFEITLGEVEVFPGSRVVYLGIEHGRDEVIRLHELLARDALDYVEPYEFHPHITLAQDFPEARLDETVATARQLWAAWRRERSFVVDRLSFVQGVDLCTWQTLRELELNHPRLRQA
jgi:2'-5' RNA ligase